MPRFRTIEVSDPAFESDGLRCITVKSPHLMGRGDITVFTPRQAQQQSSPLPLVILLHGVYGSHWVWTQKAGVHRTAQRMIDAGEITPMIIAMPSDGLLFDGTGYLAHNERRFDAWILEDVPDAVREAGLPISEDSPRYLAGLSMGGYGALRLGGLYPDRFAAFSGLSSIIEFDQLQMFVEENRSVYGLASDERSVKAVLLRNADRLPPFRFDCGKDDPLIAANRALHKALQEAKVQHVYEENPGGHEWPYWTRHIEETLRFFARS